MEKDQEPKKRTRRKKSEILQQQQEQISLANENIQLELSEVNNPVPEVKKRGRKPKGGKLLPKNKNETEEKPVVQNIILHLKCATKDLEESNNMHNHMSYNNEVPPDILTYDQNNNANTFTYIIPMMRKNLHIVIRTRKISFVQSVRKMEIL